MVSKSQTLYFFHGAYYKLAVLTDWPTAFSAQSRVLGLAGREEGAKMVLLPMSSLLPSFPSFWVFPSPGTQGSKDSTQKSSCPAKRFLLGSRVVTGSLPDELESHFL